MSKTPCKYYQHGRCLNQIVGMPHGDYNLGIRRVSQDKYNLQNNDHVLPKRANISDYSPPHLHSTRNTRLEVDYRGWKHSSSQDYHGYEDLGIHS
jgi:hypothetical protein